MTIKQANKLEKFLKLSKEKFQYEYTHEAKKYKLLLKGLYRPDLEFYPEAFKN